MIVYFKKILRSECQVVYLTTPQSLGLCTYTTPGAPALDSQSRILSLEPDNCHFKHCGAFLSQHAY